MKFKKTIFLSFLFGLTFFFGRSQTQPIFQKIDQSQGLSSSRITGIVKEKEGFIWISTQNGLNRYDGFSVKVYNKQNSNIESNDISSLYIDSKNRIWLTTYGSGLNLYDRFNDRFISFKHSSEDQFSIISNRINTIIEDFSGTFWIGTEKGLSSFDYSKNKFHNYPFKVNNELNVTSIYEDKNGNIWVGTFSNGLLMFNQVDKKFYEINAGKYKITSSINVIEELNSDKIILGSTGSGLLVVDLQTHKISNFFSNNSILKDKTKITRSIEKDIKGNLWIGTDGYGLVEIQYPNSKEPIINNYTYNSQSSSSLAGNAVYSIFEDNDSNIWIGTAWNGISVLDKKNQTEIIFSDIIGVNPSPVLSIYQNKKNIYLGLDGSGLNIFNKNKNSVTLYNKDRVGAKYIQKIVQTKDDKIWLGTFGNGLISFNENTAKIKKYTNKFNDNNSISFDDVRDIIEDENNNLWIATWGGGLNYYDAKKESFSRFYSPINNNLVKILKQNHKIWIASFGGGLSCFDIKKNEFTNYTFKENDSTTISSNNLFSILKDKKGYLWIGTSGGGINRMNLQTKKIERFEDFESIRYKNITSIIEDNNDNVWFGSKNGIIKYSYPNNAFTTFTNLSGDFHINSNFKDEKGFLYFGGINGIIKFDPKTVSNTTLQPNVIIRNFKIFNKEVKIEEKNILNKNITLTDKITLEHFQDVITFEFSALKFPFSNNCEYAIKMENFDEDWRNIGKDRTATYTNLSHGNYTLKVKSREIGSSWTSDFTSLKVNILKPYWLTWWAYLGYFILLLILLYAVRKNIIAWGKLKANLELEKFSHDKDNEVYNLKQQFFTNISHEIRTPVTLILSSINRLFNNDKIKDKKQIKAAHTIRRNSSLLLRLVNELLDVRKLESNEIDLNITKGEFVSFVKEIYMSFSDIAEDRNIKYIFNTDENNIFLWFDNNQLEKVVFNLISNSFKFTEDSGKIVVKIETRLDHILLYVEDTGIGLSTDEQSKIFDRFYQVKYKHTQNNKGFGLGLSIVKDIVKLHKGEIVVKSQPKKGSTFELKLIKGAKHFNDSNETDNKGLGTDKKIIKLQSKIDKQIKNKNKILIVEDNIEIQESLKELLEEENYEVLQAFNGDEGLKLASTSLPDLIISDLTMPKMDGVVLSKKLKNNGITSHIPIIILTARTSIADKMESYETGADEYIIKPYDEEFLKNRIKNLLKNRKLLKEKFINNNLVNPKELDIESQDQLFLENLYKYLEENLQTNNLKAKMISKQLNMSHSSMYKKIKALTGLTFMEFIRDYRLSIAKQLIQEMGYSVSEACYKVGYSDRKYFSKLFKIKFKNNPSYYSKS